MEKLFDSLMCGYPISSFLFWRIREENKKDWISYEFIRDFNAEAPHNSETNLDGVNQDIFLVLDGQQRITSLNIGLRGSYRYFFRRWRKTRLYLNLLWNHDNDNPEESVNEEIKETTSKGFRTLVTTLTKRMAEDLTKYLTELGIKATYMHSSIDTMERMSIIKDLRMGEYDVLVGINLLREGLDIPEVALVAILDADKEGFLRSETSLVQTIGRAARNAESKVIMYADNITGSMDRAIKETNRRRKIQESYNEEHNIIPRTIIKDVRNVLEATKVAVEEETKEVKKNLNKKEKSALIKKYTAEMMESAKNLQFERAAQLRDMIEELKK